MAASTGSHASGVREPARPIVGSPSPLGKAREALQGSGTGAPLISVCVVTGRRSALLDACLLSLLVQDCPPPFEVLVGVDNDPEAVWTVRRRFPDAYLCMT